MLVPDLVEGGNVHLSCIRFGHLPGHVIGKLVGHGAQAFDHVHKHTHSILANMVQIPAQKVSKSFKKFQKVSKSFKKFLRFSDSQDADM